MKLVYQVYLTFTEMQMTEKLRRVLCSWESIEVYTRKTEHRNMTWCSLQQIHRSWNICHDTASKWNYLPLEVSIRSTFNREIVLDARYSCLRKPLYQVQVPVAMCSKATLRYVYHMVSSMCWTAFSRSQPELEGNRHSSMLAISRAEEQPFT